jgi:hypothetical protein
VLEAPNVEGRLHVSRKAQTDEEIRVLSSVGFGIATGKDV